MKKLGLGLLAIAAVLVVALLVAPGFIDWNAHKGRISAEVRKLTGRDLAIDGDIGLTLLPSPSLSIARARLANIEGGSALSMIELASLEIRIAFFPLLQGEVKVESIELIEPRILAEVLPDGRKNWKLSAPGASGGAALGGQGEEIVDAISFDKVTITGGTLIYRDSAAGLEESLEDLNAVISAKSLLGPFTASGRASLRGLAAEFDLSSSRFVSGGATSVRMSLGIPDVEARLQVAGALSQHGETLSLRGRVKSTGKDLAALVAALPLSMAIPGYFTKPYSLNAEIAVSREQIKIDKMALELAGSHLEGGVLINFKPHTDVQVQLSATRIDLDKILQPAGATAGEASDTPVPSSAPIAPADPAAMPAWASRIPASLPGDMTASLSMAVDAAVYRGQVIRQFRLSLSLAEGLLKLEQALALFPGSSDASLTGILAPGDVQGEPGLRFDGRLEAGSDNLRGILNWLDIDTAQVPASRLRKMNLGMTIGATRSDVMLSDIDLRVDLSRINGGIAIAVRNRLGIGIGLALDKVDLDAYLPAKRRADVSGEARPASEAPTSGQADVVYSAPSGLAGFDANFDLRAGAVTLRGTKFKDLHFDATLQQGAVALREFLLGDIGGGAKLRVAGTFLNLTTAPIAQAAYDLSVHDPAALAKTLGVAPDLIPKSERLDITGTFKGSQDRVEVTSNITALGGLLTAQGTIVPLSAPLEIDLNLSAIHDDLAALVRSFAPGTGLAPGLALNIEARVQGVPESLRFSEISGKLGPGEFEGSLDLDLSGGRPRLVAELAAGVLPLAAFTGPARQAGASPSPGARPAKGAKASPRWSREAIEVGALGEIDAELNLRSEALILDSLRLDNAQLDASLKDGVIDLRKLSGTLFDGALKVSGEIHTAGEIEAGLAITAIELNLAQMAKELADSDRVTGPLNLEASLTAKGGSEAELISSLAGNGALNGTLKVRVKAEEQAGNLVLGILGQKIKGIRGVSDATSALFNAFAGTPATLQGSFTISQGVVETSDLSLDGNQAKALTQGSADLVAWRIDTRTDLYLDADPDTAYLTAELTGPLDKPNPKISGQPFRRKAAPAPDATVQQPSAPPSINPEDIIEKGLKGLFKSLNQ